jgi:hypothetical protein
MNCQCCGRDVSLVHRVNLRGLADRESYSYRSVFICSPCYRSLDTVNAIGDAGGRTYRLADKSRANKAPLYDRAKYDQYQSAEALKLGGSPSALDAP